MPRPQARKRQSRVQAVAFGIVVALLAATALTAVLAARDSGDDAPTLTRQELEAYEKAVVPLLREGGQVVELGMKAGVTDLSKPGGVPAEAIAGESDAWIRVLNTVRDELALMTPPPALAEAHRLFGDALRRYVEAARIFGEAARGPAAGRQAVIDRGLDIAESADDVYDAASAIVQRWRRDLGLGPSADFPDPTASPTSPSG